MFKVSGRGDSSCQQAQEHLTGVCACRYQLMGCSGPWQLEESNWDFGRKVNHAPPGNTGAKQRQW